MHLSLASAWSGKRWKTCLKFNNSTFKATDDWFSRYEKRECLVHRKLHSSDHSIAEVWPELRQAYDDDDIWNTDESRTYFCASTDTTNILNLRQIKGR